MLRLSPGRQLPLPLLFSDDEGSETFIGAENQTILRLALSLLSQDRGVVFYVHAGAGQGKTHFLKAVCTEALKNGLTCTYLPFGSRSQFGLGCLEGLETLDLVAIDDLQVAQEDPLWETELFYLVNRALSRGHCHLFVGATAPPAALETRLPDLTSRLCSGHLYALQPLSSTELLDALQTRAIRHGLDLTRRVSRFLVSRLPGPSEAFQALKTLDRASLEQKRRLTLPFVKDTLKL